MSVKSYAAFNEKDPLGPHKIQRRTKGSSDVVIDIEYCGVCHTDLHFARNDWGISAYPVVPGHEIIGKVLDIGTEVSRFKKGDLVGVGCMVGSCQSCVACKEDLEQYCASGMVGTYGSTDPISGGTTFGGYSESIVVDQNFVLSISEDLDAKSLAPLLCAGITTYSPLKHWAVKPGDRVGVIGLGGLGHMGVKFAAAMGAEVVMITRSSEKAKDAKMLGASEVLLSSDEKAMQANRASFDFLLNTIPVSHDLNPYVDLLKLDKTMCLVGCLNPLPDLSGMRLILRRRSVAGSVIGGIRQTQEMLDFCAKKKICCDVELIKMQDINKAYERMLKSDVKYRFVIDMKSLKDENFH